ncbi:MAG: hypothetical protein A2445_00655 [Candidatus Jacksonbacteria bacterium RIFOXYC2_FULL_44_29]|nr:MAG: hypothetical protein A2295_03870 [Candidatus Jacksonbacteria bacterium RIFOXYB2_FULL_44_15]OGY76369.1 MAG: hypothetical protein A2240_04385 [Candidatus Jacksonbacteria bacterium RIFOXYA2_FULL_43_12]OGY78007.1 MAG: hypothetical protein A2445_00655 [Candidatus Jacksonbacteria bacterium RIFOXYC2_FULL_44_29]OGY80321.1 MAG: hypothetical protein A2550_04430 [Candidatus Jacksonbacteria bacterium RIFOXYD2_FULL_43_21]HBH46200.1 hypothetical protein [Candidatus Jacksonbacteria bacterium]
MKKLTPEEIYNRLRSADPKNPGICIYCEDVVTTGKTEKHKIKEIFDLTSTTVYVEINRAPKYNFIAHIQLKNIEFIGLTK